MKHEELTAWALNELSPEERERIEAALQENPQIRQKAQQTKSFCNLLMNELRDEKLELTPEQRIALQQRKTAPGFVSPAFAAKPVRWRFVTHFAPLAAAAACAALGGFLIYERMKPVPSSQFQVAGSRSVEVEKVYPVKLGASDDLSVPFLAAEPVSSPQIHLIGLLNPTPAPTILGMSAPLLVSADAAPQNLGSGNVLRTGGGGTAFASASTAITLPTQASNININSVGGLVKTGEGMLTLNGTNTFTGGTTIRAGALEVGNAGGGSTAPQTLTFGSTAPQAEMPMQVTAGASVGSGVVQFSNGFNQTASSGTGTFSYSGAANTTVGRGTLRLSENSDMSYASIPQAKQAMPVASAPAPVALAAATSKRDSTLDNVKSRFEAPGRETYGDIIENELKDVLREPLSTFSVDVDTASYANVRRFLNENRLPPQDAVRIEELVNYFPTADAAPAANAKEPFAVKVELASCPWHSLHQLARISVKGREVAKSSQPSNLVFLVDVSGSMDEPQKLPLVKESLRMLVRQLGENDRVSLVTYASGVKLVLPPTNGTNHQAILAAIDLLTPGGGTNGSGGLQLAYEQATEAFIKGGVNRVLLCTDGDFNVGISDRAQLQDFISLHAKGGVFLSVLGFGSGNLKDETMETLADKGNGNYNYIDSLSESRKVLVEQMQGTLATIAKDVKIQVEFNPAVVRSYRLIGYENRMLAKEDFNNDAKDAGEIGAGHSVVALYELVPASLPPGEGPGRLVDTLKYQTLTSPAEKELHEQKAVTTAANVALSQEAMTVKLRYKQPEGDVSAKLEVAVPNAGKDIEKASAEMQFSAAVAGFGLLLRDSSFKGILNWELVRQLALSGKGADKLGYRGEFLQLIDKARGLKAVR